MSQIVQLKRSTLSGKVPGTGSLNLGELAVNTYDGKIYFKKSGSIESIESVLTTNSTITGSIRLEGTGSFGSLKVNDTLTVNHGETIISGSALVTNDLTILGAVNARQFNISVISSSILFESGSSKFGNTSDDIHSFTGSVNVTGSLYLNGIDLSQGNNSGSFSGSFQGDGSGLRGVVSDDIPRDGWDYNANSSASISDFNSVSDKYYIDFEQSQSTAVGTPIGLKGFLTNVSGSTQILPTLNSIDFVVGNNVVASIGASGIIATIPAGTVSGSSQLTSSYDTRYVLSGSITQTTWDNIASKPSGIVSGSTQIIENLPTGTISGSSQLTSSVLATTGSNTFRGTQIMSGSILPAIDNTYDLGSATYQWRDIYVSSGSLYIDGTKVLGSTNQELQITTDVGQSIKILEAGSDNIILQSADGDIQLKASGGGNLLFDPTSGLIDVRGTLQIQDGNKITSSGGNGVVFGNNIVVSGSIESTGNINGINLTTFSSSIASTFSNQNSATSSYEVKGTGIVSGSSQITFSGISSLPTLVSGSSQITYASISSIPSGIVSSSAQILNGSGLVSGSSQITLSSTTGFSTYSTSVDSRITTEKGRVDAILLASDADKDSFAEIVSLINSVDTSNDSTFASFYTASVNRLNNLETTSGSVNISISNINTQTGSSNTRLTALEASASTALSTNGTQATSITNLNTTTASLNTSVTNLNSTTASLNTSVTNINSTTASLNTSVSNLNTATSSYETKGRSIVSGSSQITFSGISSLPTLVSGSSQVTYANISSIPSGIVSGSSQVTLSSTTGYGSVLNQAVLTTSDVVHNNISASGNIVTGANITTSGSDLGLAIKHGSGVTDYGRIRFFENNTNSSTIHSFSNTWGTSFIASSRGAINIAGGTGVTFGPWNNPDAYITNSTGNSFIKGTLTIGNAAAATNVKLFLNGVASKAAGIEFQQSGTSQWYIGNGIASEDNNFELYNSNGNMAMKIIKSTNAITFIGNTTITGNLTISGTLTENSSLRYKENIEPIKYGLDKVLQMRGVTYNKKDNGVKEIGVIAEEIYEVLPEVVLKNEEGEIDSVSYGRITAVLIEAIKDLKKEIEELKANR